MSTPTHAVGNLPPAPQPNPAPGGAPPPVHPPTHGGHGAHTPHENKHHLHIPKDGWAVVWCIAIWTVALALCLGFCFSVVHLLDMEKVARIKTIASIVGVGLWFILAGTFYKLFLIEVPEFTTWVTISLLGSELRHYHTGVHIKRPWELAKPENCISHEMRTVEIEQNYAIHGGKAGAVVKVAYTWKVNTGVEPIKRFMSAGSADVEHYFSARVTDHIAEILGPKTVEEVFNNTIVLSKSFSEAFHGHTNEEERYGISFEGLSVEKILPNPETQKMLDKQMEAESQAKITEATKNMTSEEREYALLLAGKMTKTIAEERKSGQSQLTHVYKVSVDGVDLTHLVPALMSGMGSVSEAVKGLSSLLGQVRATPSGGHFKPQRPQQPRPPRPSPAGGNNPGGQTP